jgi:signal transduction histidine kinase
VTPRPIAVYRLRGVVAMERPASKSTAPRADAESARVRAADARASRRGRSQRNALRPLAWTVVVAVIISSLVSTPPPALHGEGLAVMVALLVFVAALGLAVSGRFGERGLAAQTATIAAIGAAGAVLLGLQPHGATALAGGTAVWMALVRLPLAPGLALAAAITLALDGAALLAGSSAQAIVATTLLCALLGLIAYFLREAREGQDRTELLLAQLEDARDEQARAAAIAERGRIASELHDVLAHSLSGAAIQLQGARVLAQREQASGQMRAAIERASELVKDGLASARQAVGALRGGELPGVAQLDSLIDGFRRDLEVDATLTVQGGPRELPNDASLALYRGAQEALTNVARHAPGATTRVVLRYERDRTTLSIEDRGLGGLESNSSGALDGAGGGRGLEGMRERLERAGGSMRAGPTDDGWRVELDVPV